MQDRWPTQRHHDGGIDLVPLPADVPGELRLCGKRAIAAGRFADLDVPWSTIVCLCRRRELTDRYPEYVAWLDERGDRSIWFPVHDLGAQPLDVSTAFVDGLVHRLRAGERLLVHCAAGVGRAGTTAVCILVRLGVPLDAALRTVADARPLAGPEAGPQLRLVRAMARAT